MQIIDAAIMLAFLARIGCASPAASLSERNDAFPWFVKASTDNSSTPIDEYPWQAVDGLYYLGGHPSTYCPETVTSCPPGNFTTYLSNGTLVCVPVSVRILKPI
jgi:hypothetical protein